MRRGLLSLLCLIFLIGVCNATSVDFVKYEPAPYIFNQPVSIYFHVNDAPTHCKMSVSHAHGGSETINVNENGDAVWNTIIYPFTDNWDDIGVEVYNLDTGGYVCGKTFYNVLKWTPINPVVGIDQKEDHSLSVAVPMIQNNRLGEVDLYIKHMDGNSNEVIDYQDKRNIIEGDVVFTVPSLPTGEYFCDVSVWSNHGYPVGKTNEKFVVGSTQVPEFPSVVVPAVVILGLVVVMGRKKR